ncbi:hypothetical protein P7F88_01730 [Vibrio hannami]|uniref:hypothetical protein n=1 Tax=Vibrio hannami TaxID=2717094 RepID=UPI00240FA447|nr:hypothetical protein [Vibrio hannami]MDG3084875.1 hypothetical protein [Vibrio hannami]
MRMAGLNFDSIPVIDVPFRFYLTAPIFAILASLLLLDQGSNIWLTRWMPGTLAITHLIALGVMGMVMIGSLFQVMPVLCGAPIPITGIRVSLLHIAFSAGAFFLCAAFVGWVSFDIGFGLLGLSLGYFVFALMKVLIVQASGEQTRLPILFAIAALGIVMFAGLMLLSGYLWGWQLASGKSLTNLHAGTALFGWVMLLVMAVSFQVIPMFHVTPVFPRYWQVGLVLATLVGLWLIIADTLAGTNISQIGSLNALVAILYAGLGLNRISKRKRKLPDVVISYWQVAFVSLIAGCTLLIALPFLSTEWQSKTEVFMAMIIGCGFILGIIQGMLLKIVPFLISLHLQSVAMKNPASMMLLPDHYSLISRSQGKAQFWLYIAVLVSISIAFLHPEFTQFLGLIFMANWLCVGYNIVTAATRYSRVRNEMLEYNA